MKRYAVYLFAGSLVTAGNSMALAADDVRRPAGERTDLQQFLFPMSDASGGDRAVAPELVPIISAYGGGISPRTPDFIYVPVNGGVDPGNGGGAGKGGPSTSFRGGAPNQVRVPSTAAILPRDAKSYVLRSVGMPQTPAQRTETLRALYNLADVPVAQARQMFTPPAFIQESQKANYFRTMVQKVAAGKVAAPARFAVVVAPESTEGSEAQALRSKAKAKLSFRGVAADAVLAGAFTGTARDEQLKQFGTGISGAIADSKAQIWFANGVETILPQTAAAVYSSEQVGGIVTAGAQGAKAVRATDQQNVADAISVFGKETGKAENAPAQSSTVDTIVSAVGPAALVTYAANANDAVTAAAAIRENKKFGSAGSVAVLLQGNEGTEMLLF